MICRHCGFQPNEMGELDWKHIYCVRCRSIIHFHILMPDRHIGRCSCGIMVEELHNGAILWQDHGRVIHTFPADPMFAKSAYEVRT